MAINDTKPRMIVLDLDGTLLHDADSFEQRYISDRSIRAIEALHQQGTKVTVATARPVSTSFDIVQQFPVDACIYLNGALIDYHPSLSSYDMLTGGAVPSDGHLEKIGFTSERASRVCTELLSKISPLQLGIVMDDVRYTNFDISVYWKTQEYQYSDFTDVPHGIADKIIVFPEEQQIKDLEASIPPDFSVSISEGSLWMLMNPSANKEASVRAVCKRMGIPMEQTVAFGDDLIDMAMLKQSGRGVAVANAHPEVLRIADTICPSNNDDGVAQWIEALL